MNVDLLSSVFERLDVVEAREISLEESPTMDRPVYIARSRSRRTLVDRPLAIRLRTDGAIWRGDITRDPCAVA